MRRRFTRSLSATTARPPRTRWPSAWASPRRRRRACASASASSGSSTTCPTRACELTADGERVALEVIRHHRLLELYLAESLDVPWDRVHAEAEVLEHVLSEELEALIAAKLGNPTVDPHGDPIPTADLVIEERPTSALADLAAGARGDLRAHLGLRSRDAALPGRARHRARATTSRSSTSSRSTAPPSLASATTCTCSAGRWRAPCGPRWLRDRRRRLTSGAEPTAAAAVARAAARDPGRARAGLRGLHRLRRPRQLRHEHRGRRQVRLPAAVGAAQRQPHGDADPEPVGQDRHRHRAEPGRAVPRSLPAAGRVGPVDPGRAHRHGHRPGRVRRRRDRAEPALPRAALLGRAHHRGRRLRDPRPADQGLPALRGRHRRAARAHHPRLPLRHAEDRLRRRARPPRASSRASRGPTRCCWRPPSSAPRSCRT